MVAEYLDVQIEDNNYKIITLVTIINVVITISPHFENPGIVRTVHSSIQGYLGISKDTDGYSATLTGAKLAGEGRPPLPFLKIKKSVLILERKTLIVSIFGLNVPFKM